MSAQYEKFFLKCEVKSNDVEMKVATCEFRYNELPEVINPINSGMIICDSNNEFYWI